jgi:splicing factor 3A subunit 1
MKLNENEILENAPEKKKTEEQEHKNPLGAGISMIYPPPETKKVIDKAATLVAQYGIQVETSMKEDPNFSFINNSDPYYPYYQSKIIEFKEELLKDLSKKKEEYYSQNNDISNKDNQNPEFLNKKRKEDNLVELEKEAKVLLKEAMQDKIDLLRSDKNLNNLEKIPQPVPDMFSVAQPNISGTELDIIKISAQFVAKNGQKFLSDLIRREKDNPQFDFMKPQHTLFGYFTFLVGCYAKILNKNEIMSKIEKYATNSDEILKSANMHYLYEKKMSKIPRGKRFSQEDLLTNEEKEKAKQIDWYDFVVIETINFSSDEEEKSENSNKEIVGKENIYNTNYTNPNNKEITDNDNETIYTNEDNNTIINSVEDERTFYTNNNNNGINPNNGQEVVYINGKKVIKNYVREKKKRILDQGVDDVNEVKCPLCKLSIKPNKIEEHLKIELLDPKWKKIQEVIDKNQVQTNLAGTGDLLIYLDQFSKSRPDLFGEVDDIKKLEKKRKEEKEKNIDHVTFNGYAPLMSRTTANNNMIKIQNIRHIEESKKPKELKNIMKK